MPPFAAEERLAQTRFKQTSPDFSPDARADGYYGQKGPYPFCIPASHAVENLFPPIRWTAPCYFPSHGIHWHGPQGNGPNNHLLSSQVACVNFLFPFLDKPEALTSLLRPHFPTIRRVLPQTGSCPGYITFEWIGEKDYLTEGKRNGTRTRGANCTSADAMLMFEEEDGTRRVLLLEWKYTEKYGQSGLATGTSGQKRMGTYQPFLCASDSPVNMGLVPNLQALFFEPFYQLMRLQLLAHELEKDLNSLEDATYRVTVAHISPKRNIALQKVTSPALVPLGATVSQVWRRLVRQPDRFEAIASEELFGGFDMTGLPPGQWNALREWWHYMKARYNWL